MSYEKQIPDVGTEPIDPVSERLLRAAQIIRERGWCRERVTTSRGSVCLVGAIKLASGDDIHGALGSASWEAYDRVRRHLGVPAQGLAAWNDEQPSRKAVIAALEAAAFSPSPASEASGPHA